jgi:hypothetical protein
MTIDKTPAIILRPSKPYNKMENLDVYYYVRRRICIQHEFDF